MMSPGSVKFAEEISSYVSWENGAQIGGFKTNAVRFGFIWQKTQITEAQTNKGLF